MPMEQTYTVRPIRWQMSIFALLTGLGTYHSMMEGDKQAILLFGVPTFMLAYVLLRGLNSITLDREGIHQVRFLATRTWRWNEVGPFSLSSQSFRSGFTRQTNHYACAFTNERHSMLAAHGRQLTPTFKNADIMVQLQMTEAGKSEQTAIEFANRLNQMRALFGGPEILIRQRDPVAAAKMERTVKWRPVWFWLKIIIGLIVIIPLFAMMG